MSWIVCNWYAVEGRGRVRVDYRHSGNLGRQQYPAFRVVGLAARRSAPSMLACPVSRRWRTSEPNASCLAICPTVTPAQLYKAAGISKKRIHQCIVGKALVLTPGNCRLKLDGRSPLQPEPPLSRTNKHPEPSDSLRD